MNVLKVSITWNCFPVSSDNLALLAEPLAQKIILCGSSKPVSNSRTGFTKGDPVTCMTVNSVARATAYVMYSVSC
jgi:hypothetical protein